MSQTIKVSSSIQS